MGLETFNFLLHILDLGLFLAQLVLGLLEFPVHLQVELSHFCIQLVVSGKCLVALFFESLFVGNLSLQPVGQLVSFDFQIRYSELQLVRVLGWLLRVPASRQN